MLPTYFKVWRIMFYFFAGEYEQHKLAIKDLKGSFFAIPLSQNLVMNLFTYSGFIISMNWIVGFSEHHQRFVLIWSVLPTFSMGLVYYFYVFGVSAFRISMVTMVQYIYNWLQMCSVAAVCFTQVMIWHFICLLIEMALPSTLRGTISFPLNIVESYVQQAIMLFYGFGAFLIFTTPVWMYAYKLNFALLERNEKISAFTVVMEILYTTSHSASAILIQTIFAFLQIRAGLPFHGVHFVSELLLALFAHQSALIKFVWVHQLLHEIRPLYALAHAEHHVCKGIYPTSPGLALWETFVLGGSIFCSSVFASIPFLSFQLLYCGLNIVVHTMWPSRRWAQWHTSHHLAHSDIYAANVPSAFDERFSTDLKKFLGRMEKESPFVRTWWFSDAAGVALLASISLAMHYLGGIGIGYTWHTGVWAA